MTAAVRPAEEGVARFPFESAGAVVIGLGPLLAGCVHRYIPLGGLGTLAVAVVAAVVISGNDHVRVRFGGAILALLVIGAVTTRPPIAVYAVACFLVAIMAQSLVSRGGPADGRWSGTVVAVVGWMVGSLVWLTTPRATVPALIVLSGAGFGYALRWSRNATVARVDRHLIGVSDRAVSCARHLRGTADVRTATWRRPVALLFVVVVAGLIAYQDRRLVLLDDAAITFRYADRIADGLGFTYNDGDRTNGASAPGYTLLLAMLRWFGIAPVAAATALAVATYAASVGVVAWVTNRIAGLAAAMLATWLLLAGWTFRTQMMGGMESGLAVVLGLLAIVAILHDRPVLCGTFVGLAVFNKMDAGLLAGAVFLAWLLARKRVPWKVIIAASAVVLPWAIFATVYFGSPVPFSATQKLGAVEDTTVPYDPLWMLNGLISNREVLLVVLVAASLPMLVSRIGRSDERSLATLAIGLWSLSHFAAFSLVDLGDHFPWYLTAMIPGFAVLAGVSAAWWWDVVSDRLRTVPAAAVTVAMAGLVVVAAASMTQVVELQRLAVHGHRVDPYEEFEATRRDAGRWLGEHAEPGDVVESCFGWVAYGALDNPIREVCPLSTRKEVGPTRWVGEAWHPEIVEPTNGGGRTVVAEFRSFADPPGASFVIRIDQPGDDQGDEPASDPSNDPED